MKGNAVVGQSGGPTAVINASLAGVIEACGADARVGSVLGTRFGIEGFMDEHLVDLSSLRGDRLEALALTPSSALGSCRHKLVDEDFPRILEVLKRRDIRYFFLIGGNDTMDTIHRIESWCGQRGWELRGIGIPKTVDNDLHGTDHSPGYPSAARWVALSVAQAGRLAKDMRKVDSFVVHQTVGRDSGWLAAASALARSRPGDAPHLIYLPERRISREGLVADARDCIARWGWCSIVCGEGVLWEDGRAVSATSSRDRFSNVEFGAMGGGSAALAIHAILREATGMRGEFQITESLPMCADDRVAVLDRLEARACGRKAAELALGGQSGVMVTIHRSPGKDYSPLYGTIPLSEVAVRAKPMPDSFLVPGRSDVSESFLEYLRPLVGPMPRYFDIETIGQK